MFRNTHVHTVTALLTIGIFTVSDTPYDLPTRYIWGTVEYPALRYNAWWEVGNAQEKAVANFLYHVLLDDL